MAGRPFLLGGSERRGDRVEPVRNPYDGSTVSEIVRPGPRDLEDAIRTAAAAMPAMRAWPAWRRAEALRAAAARVAAARARFARAICVEAGKPISQARGEVDRCVQTLLASAEEAGRIGGEVLPLDAAPGHEGRIAITRRFPVGPVACITPFNFPLNLVAHKIGPALAAGCPFVLKPASQTPGPALDLAAVLLESGVPPQAVSVLPLGGADSAPLVEDPRLKALSFTGSQDVGWDLRRRAGRKKVVLELGGNAGLIVDRSADVSLAASRAVSGGFGYAGQSCISVQRILAHREIHHELLGAVLEGARAQVVGDPLDEATTVGPMITEADAVRVEQWIGEAVAAGGRVLAGGMRKGPLVEATVLTGVPAGCKARDREAFAPLVLVDPFDRLEEAIAEVNRSDYGLQAGLFTRDLSAALAAFEDLDVGAVVINDAPTYRADRMPYGGVKASGMGREGPRYAIEDYTELRVMVLAGTPR